MVFVAKGRGKRRHHHHLSSQSRAYSLLENHDESTFPHVQSSLRATSADEFERGAHKEKKDKTLWIINVINLGYNEGKS